MPLNGGKRNALAVELRGVSKTFPNGKRALTALDLSIAPGELVVLVGPSGSGKTTTLRIVAGLEHPSAGTVHVGGRDVTCLPARARHVAMVFQRNTLYPHLTVGQNLTFPLALSRWSVWRSAAAALGFVMLPALKDDARLQDAAKALGLTPLLDRWPSELSGGEQQRVALGKALVRGADILLLDQPLNDLDPGTKDEARSLVRSVHGSLGCTTLYVTHDQQEALLLGDRVGVLHEGRMEQIDAPERIYRLPANRFVAEFFGWPRMNFLTGRLTLSGNGWVFGGEAWSFPVLSDTIPMGWTLPEQPLLLGVRPECVQIDVPRGLPMDVRAIEFLGADDVLWLRRAGLSLTATARGNQRPRLGDIVTVGFEMKNVNWFDAVTGAAVGLRAPDG